MQSPKRALTLWSRAQLLADMVVQALASGSHIYKGMLAGRLWGIVLGSWSVHMLGNPGARGFSACTQA
jgi:hypothetical protein